MVLRKTSKVYTKTAKHLLRILIKNVRVKLHIRFNIWIQAKLNTWLNFHFRKRHSFIIVFKVKQNNMPSNILSFKNFIMHFHYGKSKHRLNTGNQWLNSRIENNPYTFLLLDTCFWQTSFCGQKTAFQQLGKN